MGFKERLEELIEEREDGNQSAFARRSGVDPASIRQYLAGSMPTLGKVINIARAYDVSLDWLIGEDSSTHASLPTSMEGWVPIPRLNIHASAGNGRLALLEDAEAEVVAFKSEWLRRLGVSPRHAQIIIAEGDSMEPTIGHGDLVLIDRSVDHIVDEGIYVLVYAGMVKLKRIQVLLSGIVLLKSDNPAYQTEEIKSHELPELIIEGRVRWAGRAI